jgi:L-malate glycosyltransferase
VAEIHQLIPSFVSRDAQGAHVLKVQQVLRDMGVDSDVYAADIEPAFAHLAKPYQRLDDRRPRGRRWLLYQLSTGNPLATWVRKRPEPKIVNFHNITPPEFFAQWNPGVAAEVQAGRRQVAQLAPVTDLAIAVSRFNEQDLLAAGYRRTAVVPLFTDLGGRVEDDEPVTVNRSSSAGARWLFVGRLIPNKCQQDLIASLAAYRRLYDPEAELVLVGKSTFAAYDRALQDYAARLGLERAVHFEGSVTPAALAAHYEAADVVVCVSEHEGFCAPLLEAMLHDVPVVAFAAAAVSETVADAGLVLDDKSPSVVAAAVNRVLRDDTLRSELVRRGRERAKEFDHDRIAARLRSVIEELLAG